MCLTFLFICLILHFQIMVDPVQRPIWMGVLPQSLHFLFFLCSHNLLTHLHHSCICICIYSLLIEYYSVSEWNFINKLHDLNLRWRWLWSCQIAKVYWDVTDSSDAPKDHIPKSLQICDWLSWYRWLLAKQELSTSSCFSKFFSSFSPLTQCHNSHSSWVR